MATVGDTIRVNGLGTGRFVDAMESYSAQYRERISELKAQLEDCGIAHGRMNQKLADQIDIKDQIEAENTSLKAERTDLINDVVRLNEEASLLEAELATLRGQKKPDNRIITFLLGESDYNGFWYGDSMGRAPFWWRSELRKFLNEYTAPPQTQTKEQNT